MAGLLNYKDDPVMGLIGDIYKGAGQRVGDYFKPEKHGLTDQQLKDYMMGFQTMGEGFDDYINQPDAPFGTTQTGEEYTNRVNIGQSMLPGGSQLSGLAHGRAAIDQAQRMYNGEDVLGEDGLLLPALGNAGVGLAELAQMGAIPKSLLGMGAMVKAYHGTPHKVDKFRMDKIGTGEGAQAYGHGLYFAENPDVAGQYSDMFAKSPASSGQLTKLRDSSPIGSAEWTHYDDLIKQNGKGNLYNVNLDVNHEDLLDWDAPIPNEMISKIPKEIRFGMEDVLEEYGMTGDLTDMTGSEIYKTLSNALSGDYVDWPNAKYLDEGNANEAASYLLKESGIPGIRYLDQGSRGSKEGTRNLVMFDEDLIKIADDFKFPDELKSLKGEPVNKINEMRATTKANPVTVYHSTGEQFDKFDPEKGIGGQMWFTSRKDLAEQGYDGAVSKGRLVEAELDIRNPASWAEYDKYGTDELLGMGYDGVKLEQNGEDVYIALFPEQIRVKSNK
jgi:hypothetical protein